MSQQGPPNDTGDGLIDPSAVPNIKAEVEGEWTVDKALATMTEDAPIEGASSPVPYFHFLERLKTTQRKGWIRFGIEQGECVAGHQWRMAMMAMLAPASLREKLDVERCVSIALVHDMAEALVGDLTPDDGVPKPEKNRRESTTMDYVTQRLLGGCDSGPAAAARIRALWQEYEDAATPESVFVHDIDKVELVLQMVEYEKRAGGTIHLDEFLDTAKKITMPEMQAWAKEILDGRTKWWQARSTPQ